MEIVIKGTEKEIVDFVKELQSQPDEKNVGDYLPLSGEEPK